MSDSQEGSPVTPAKRTPLPRGNRVDDTKRNTIVRLLFHRCRQQEIAQELGVSVNLVKKVERNLLDYGTPSKPDPPPKGRPPQLKTEILEEMLQVYEMTGFDIGQKQICQWLEGRHGIKVSQSTISRIIKKSGRKKAVAVVAQAKKIQEEAEKGNTDHAMNHEAFREANGNGYRPSEYPVDEGSRHASPISDASTEVQTNEHAQTATPLDPKLAAG